MFDCLRDGMLLLLGGAAGGLGMKSAGNETVTFEAGSSEAEVKLSLGTIGYALLI